MRRDRSLLGAFALAAVVGVGAFPLLGWYGSVPLGAAAFGAVALIGSGYHVVRAIFWAILIAALITAGLLLPEPLGRLLYGLGAALFLAGFLAPAFRRWWFGGTLE